MSGDDDGDHDARPRQWTATEPPSTSSATRAHAPQKVGAQTLVEKEHGSAARRGKHAHAKRAPAPKGEEEINSDDGVNATRADLLDLDPPAIKFGKVPLRGKEQTDAAPYVVTAFNTTGDAVTLDDIHADADADFPIFSGDTTDTTIAPGGALQFRVGFRPHRVGAQSSTVHLIQRGVSIGRVHVEATAIDENDHWEVLGVWPNKLKFPNTAIGEESPLEKVAIRNKSGVPIRVEDVAPVEGAGDQFRVYQTDGGEIPAGAATTLSIGFRPTAPGEQRATLAVRTPGTDHDKDVAHGRIAVRGTGVAADSSEAEDTKARTEAAEGGDITGPLLTVDDMDARLRAASALVEAERYDRAEQAAATVQEHLQVIASPARVDEVMREYGYGSDDGRAEVEHVVQVVRDFRRQIRLGEKVNPAPVLTAFEAARGRLALMTGEARTSPELAAADAGGRMTVDLSERAALAMAAGPALADAALAVIENPAVALRGAAMGAAANPVATVAVATTGEQMAEQGRDSLDPGQLLQNIVFTMLEAAGGAEPDEAVPTTAREGAEVEQSLAREEIPEELARHQRAGATVRAVGGDGERAYEVEYPDGRRFRIVEAEASPTPRAGAPSPAEAAAARANADRAAAVQAGRDAQLTELIQSHRGPVVADTVILGAGRAGTLAYQTLGGGPGAPPGVELDQIPARFNIAPDGSMFENHGDFPLGQAAPELAGGAAAGMRSPGEYTADHTAPVAASDEVRALQASGYESGMVTYKATVTQVEVRPANGWGDGVPPEAADMPIRLTAGGKTIYVRRFISAGGLGAPRALGEPGSAIAGHEAALVAAGKLVYAQESLTLPGGAKTVIVIGDGPTGAWASEHALANGASKVYWIGRTPRDPATVPPATRARLVEIGLDDSQIESFGRSYNKRNASTFQAIADGKIELRIDIADVNLDPKTNRVTATLKDGTTVEADGVLSATGQVLSVPNGMDDDSLMRFKMVKVNEHGRIRVVALDAYDPRDGHPLGIRIVGAQMAQAAPLIEDKGERSEFLDRLRKQADDPSVPSDSRGVVGSNYQSNVDIPLASQVEIGGGAQ